MEVKSRVAFPMYSCLGLAIRVFLSSISFQCESHPEVLAIAKRTVNIFTGNPIA